MHRKFEENSVLNNYSSYTPFKDIFQAVCDELARHYTDNGWKYARSRPKLSLSKKDIKIEIAFWSSGSNTPGSYVNLEILPVIYSPELVNQLKTKGIKSKGYILGFTHLFTERFDGKEKGLKKIINTLSKDIERIEESNYEPELKINNSINVYGIKENDISKIIELIDERVSVWIDRISNVEEIKTFINKLTKNDKTDLLKGDFGETLTLKFPNEKFE